MIGFFGDLGSFKTASLVALMRDYVSRGLPVYANFDVKLKGAKRLKVAELLQLTCESGGKGLMGIDEIYALAESRVSSSRVNRFVSYFGFQSRKLGWDVGYTAQLASSVDLRFFNLTDVKVACLGLQEDMTVKLVVESGGSRVVRHIPYSFYVENVFPYYETLEVVSPLGVADLLVSINEFDTPEINRMVDESVAVVRKELGRVDQYRLTKAVVEDAMLKIGEPLALSTMVYNRLKRFG